MTEIETIAAAFRAALVPTVADRMPWPKMTPDSQRSYVDATEAAMLKVLAPVVTAAAAEVEAENAVLLRFVEEQGFSMERNPEGGIEFRPVVESSEPSAELQEAPLL